MENWEVWKGGLKLEAEKQAFVILWMIYQNCQRNLGKQQRWFWKKIQTLQYIKNIWFVNAMHITASVFINDNESGLHQDYEEWLEELAPHEPISRYRHNLTGEDNGDAHLKRQIMGREVVVAITNGRLDFGP